MIELRDYQIKAVKEIVNIISRYNVAYLAGMPRVGKTFMSLDTARQMKWRKICFITKKSAISSIRKDYQDFGHQFFAFDIFNFEQSHNIYPVYDAYIIDEAHCIGAFPKPGEQCKNIRKLIHTKKSPCLLMSGTPSAEGFSQIFHQFWVSPFSPFQGYGHRSGEFYGWAKEYVDVKKKFINGFAINDYKKANEAKIKEVLQHYMISVSQQDAGFTSFVEEEVFYVDVDKRLYQLMDVLKEQKVYQMKKTGDYIVADTPARLQQCFHQLSSGTIITGEDPAKKYHVIDESKAHFIKKHFAGKKIAIYYYYVSEGDLLRKIFPMHTDSPEVFNENDGIVFIRQMVSGSLGVNISTCDWLLMYNIGFSANVYWQVRARMQTKDRTKPSKLGWIFSREGIENHVLKALHKKLDFTNSYFRKVYRING